MKAEVKFVHMDSSSTLENFVNEKIKHAERKYPWILKTKVTFEKLNSNDGLNKKCNIIGVIPGSDKFATATAHTYQGAFKKALFEVEKQLEKRKQQMKCYI